jgi:hypothetical protein
VAVWGPWWGPQELARAQDVAGEFPDGLSEASEVDEPNPSTKEDERVYGSKEGPETGNLPEDEGYRSTEASTGSPNAGGPSLVSDTADLQGGAIGQDPELESEANAAPGIGLEQVGVLEIRKGSAEVASQEHSGAEHLEEGAANGHSSEPTGTDIWPHPKVVPPAERETSVATEGGNGPTSQDDGEDQEALHAEGPVVYEATTDPDVSPRIRVEQAKTMAQALAKGDPDTMRVVKQLLKGKLEEFHHSLAKADSRSGSVYTN